MNTCVKLAALVLGLSTIANQISTCFAQGSLTPPGAPAPIMKTLDQVEPRTPISSLPFTISQPGSYYLTSNLWATPLMQGISIATNNVTLDLGGFTLFGTTGSSAVLALAGCTRGVSVLNGRLVDWTAGILANTVSNLVVADLEIVCVSGGAYRYGIYAGNNASVLRCQVSSVDGTGSTAISVGANCRVEGTTVRASTTGIWINNGSRVEQCTASDCVSEGIFGQNGCIVRNNLVEHCGGIRVFGNSSVRDNVVLNCAGSGIYAAGSFNRFERNTANFNTFGIQTVSGSTNFVVQNIACGNTNGNYNFLGSVMAGPTVTTVGTVTNHPWANFSF